MVTTPREHGVERRQGVLCWDGISLAALADQYGTPLFLVNRHPLEAAYRDIQAAFSAAGVPSHVFFSVKTNPLPAILRILSNAGAGAEVISEYELWLALRAGFSGHRIVVNGASKPDTLLRTAVRNQAALINLESESQAEALRRVVLQEQCTVHVGLRVNPCLRARRMDFTVSNGTAGSAAGFVRGSEPWKRTLELLKSTPAMKLRGIQFHLGTGIRSAGPYREALGRMVEVWGELSTLGLRPELLDIGGGYSVSTLKEFDLWQAIRFFGWNVSPKAPRPTQGLMSEVAGFCAKFLSTLGCRHPEAPPPAIALEPGRALTGPCQMLLVRVAEIISKNSRELVAVCDGGALSLSLMMLCEYHDILPVAVRGGAPERLYSLVGSLPTPLDVICRKRLFPSLQRGDTVAILDTGAYFTSLATTFAGPRPPVVLLAEQGPVLVRRRETFDDLVARDLLNGND